MFSRLAAVDVDRVVPLEEALAALGSADTPARARLLASLANELYWADDQRRHALSTEALGIARRLGDAATLPLTLESRARFG
jgi:predicted GNAT superfamily acetyltransferase